MNKELLIRLRDMPEFQDIMAATLLYRPVVPQWRPEGGQEATRLIEEIKYKTGAQAGFDALYVLLTGRNVNYERADEHRAV